MSLQSHTISSSSFTLQCSVSFWRFLVWSRLTWQWRKTSPSNTIQPLPLSSRQFPVSFRPLLHQWFLFLYTVFLSLFLSLLPFPSFLQFPLMSSLIPLLRSSIPAALGCLYASSSYSVWKCPLLLLLLLRMYALRLRLVHVWESGTLGTKTPFDPVATLIVYTPFARHHLSLFFPCFGRTASICLEHTWQQDKSIDIQSYLVVFVVSPFVCSPFFYVLLLLLFFLCFVYNWVMPFLCSWRNAEAPNCRRGSLRVGQTDAMEGRPWRMASFKMPTTCTKRALQIQQWEKRWEERKKQTKGGESKGKEKVRLRNDCVYNRVFFHLKTIHHDETEKRTHFGRRGA